MAPARSAVDGHPGTALMGMTMIIGIGTEMAIFYLSEYAELALHMALREASRCCTASSTSSQ